MIPFEEIQEQCVQNKEKVDKYSKIISISLFFISIFIIYDYGFIFCNNKLLWIAGIISYTPFICFTSEERIYSKIPAILGTCLIVIATIIAIKESFFSSGLSAKNLIEYVFNSFNLYTITYSIHCIIVYILGHTIFKNNKIKYTARIIELEDSKGKNNSHTYYAHFYDYTNKENKCKISVIEYITWKEGDYIETILQPQVDEITVKKIKHLTNFEGKTDMEIFQERHKRDVELFGQSQEEMDAAKGEYKLESYLHIFLVIGIIDLLVCSFNKKFSFHDNIIYALTTTLSLATIIYTSYKEYSMIKSKDNYTLEDMAIWKDYLVPRCLFYFLTTYFFVEGIINLIERIIF